MSEKPRLAIMLPNLEGGGAERVAIAMARGFAGHGHPVDLVLGQAKGALLSLVPPGVRVINLESPRARGMVGPLVRYMRRERPAAIHAMMWPLPMFALIAATIARTQIRIVASEHTTLSKVPRSQWGERFTKSLLRLVYPRLDAIVGVSQGVASDLARFASLPPHRVRVVHNPLDLPPLDGPSAGDAWPTTAGRILAVGSLKAEKNYPLLIDAMRKVVAVREASLVILGDGALRPAMEEQIRKQNLQHAISLVGFNADPWPYYRAADLFVLSSDFEGLPTVLIEALHQGLAIVSTDCESGPREILAGGRFGQLVACGDAAALANGMLTAFNQHPEGDALRARAAQLAGQLPMTRHLDLMVPGSGTTSTAQRGTK